MIDIYTSIFWFFVVVSFLLLSPINRGPARKWAFAVLNFVFVAIYLHTQAAYVLAAMVVAFIVLQIIERAPTRLGIVVTALAGAGVFVLFVVHKLPSLGERIHLGSITGVLKLIGFSYMALRLVEAGRAVSEKRRPAPNFPSTINYLMPFHMLALGPIQSYDDFCDQPAVPPPLGFAASLRAFERIGMGLFKKFVLANFIDDVLLTHFHSHGPYFFIEMQFNYLWLFLDFSAFSDLAVGIGTLMGVATPENFNRPYIARNMIDYWDRWHISLSLFIRHNLFIPLQLAMMRKTDGRNPLWIASIAFTISFLLCGLWHRIELGWFLWGGYHALGLVVCNLYKSYLLKRLGRKGMNKYLANPWIRAVAIVVVYEYVAFSLVVANFSIHSADPVMP